jgi:hypothetical protein
MSGYTLSRRGVLAGAGALGAAAALGGCATATTTVNTVASRRSAPSCPPT